MDEQDRVAAFLDEHDLSAPPEFRLIDLVAELGEIAKEMAESTTYGEDPAALSVSRDEVGDAFFALLALADRLDIDAREALGESLSKYERRIDDEGDPGSG